MKLNRLAGFSSYRPALIPYALLPALCGRGDP